MSIAHDASLIPPPAFGTVVFDIDSTLSGIEGIDWLAARRSPDVAQAVLDLTARAMDGSLAVEEVYARRLGLVRPSLEEINALIQAYIGNTAPGAATLLDQLRRAAVHVIAVSGGLREACVPFCATLGFAAAEVYGVSVRFSVDGSYEGFDTASPLTKKNGKPVLVRALALPRPLLAIGDGITDLEIKTAGEADVFAAFAGFVRRPVICAQADHIVTSMTDVLPLVFPPIK